MPLCSHSQSKYEEAYSMAEMTCSNPIRVERAVCYNVSGYSVVFQRASSSLSNTCGFAFADCTALLSDEAAIIHGSMGLTGPEDNQKKKQITRLTLPEPALARLLYSLGLPTFELVENVKFLFTFVKVHRLQK